MKGKIKCLIIATVISISAFAGGLFTQKAEAANVSVVPEGYKAIRTIEDLRGINNDTSGKYILMNDIDLTEATKKGGSYDTGNGWTPLDTFKGVLDGNGYRIKGMHIYGDKLMYVGLFSKVDGATIRNLGIIDCDIDVEKGKKIYSLHVAPIACYYNDNNYYYGTSYIDNCFATGKIKAKSNDEYTPAVYGLVGDIRGYISNCYSNVILSTEGCEEYAISHEYYRNERNCYFAGSSISENIEFKGSSCYYLDGSLIKSSYVDATPLTQTQMRSKTSFTGWNFDKTLDFESERETYLDETWYIDPYSYYQYPQLKSVPQVRISGIEMISMPTKTTYAQGEDISLDGAVVKLIYEDGNTATVTVNDDFKAEYDNLKIGTQNVKLSYLDGSTTFPVTFTGFEVSDIELSASATNVAFGNKVNFTAVTKPEQALDNKLTWSLKDENGKEVKEEDAYITQDGTFLGKKLGKYVVTVSANNGVSKSYTVTVTKPMVYLIADPEELTMNSGESATINLKQSPLDSIEDIKWKSSDEQIATVENGVVTAHMPGRAVITAKTESCDYARCTVTVIQNIMQCDISGLTNQVYTGNEITLNNLKVYGEKGLLRRGVDYTVDYEDNTDIGTATVIITGCGLYSGTITKTFEIVRGDLKKAKISSTSISLKVRGTKKLRITGAAGYTIKWSSKSKKIATVDKNGKVTAKKAGKTYIYAKVGSRTFKCKVIVRK